MPGGAALLPPDDALRAALVDVIADLEHEWRRERERIEAQAGLVIAELRAEVAALSAERVAIRVAIDEAVAARLATVKDGEPGRSVTIEDVAPVIVSEVQRAVAAIPAPKDGESGRGVDPAEVHAAVREAVADAVAALPPAPAGRDADPAVVEAMVRDAVAAIPPPKDGRDADPAEIARLVADAVARIPVPKDGVSVDPEDVRAMVEATVAALPPAPAGRDADPAVVAVLVLDAVRPEIGAAVSRAVDDAIAALPPAPAGKDADPEMVRALVETVVAALPPPEPGRPGEPGAPGKLPVVREWADGVHYEADVVTHGGAVYQAQRDTGREPPHEDWLLIAAAGRDGQDGRSLNIRATWNEAETYRRLDVVALNGAAFCARRDDPGPCPGEGWQMIAAQGKAGKPGEVGKGLRGEPGKAGPPVAAMHIDAEGMLTLTNADGSVVTCDLYPVLAKAGR